LRDDVHVDPADIHVGRHYAYPTNPGPLAGPPAAARVQIIESRRGGRVLVRIVDPGRRAKDVPIPLKVLVPGAIVEVAARDLACPWSQWPEGNHPTG
jgi:hypothetical protein